MRGSFTCALVAASLAFAGAPALRAECHDAPCSSPCSSPCSAPTVVNASAPNVIVDVPPPNIIIRAVGTAECGEHECLIKRCCHLCRPCYVQPAMPTYGAPAGPVMYQAAPLAPSYAFQAAPLAPSYAFQAAPAAPSYAFQAAPSFAFQAAPVAPSFAFQAAPAAAPMMVQLVPAAAPAAPAAPNTMDCNQALQKITKEIETLKDAVDQHSDYIKIHEMRLLRIEDQLNKTAPEAKKFDIITDLEKLKEATKDLPAKR